MTLLHQLCAAVGIDAPHSSFNPSGVQDVESKLEAGDTMGFPGGAIIITAAAAPVRERHWCAWHIMPKASRWHQHNFWYRYCCMAVVRVCYTPGAGSCWRGALQAKLHCSQCAVRLWLTV